MSSVVESNTTTPTPTPASTADNTSRTTSYNVDDYIKTITTNTYVSRDATIDGARQVEMKGKSIIQNNVRLRGDLSIIKIGRYCYFNTDTIIIPPYIPEINNNETTNTNTDINKKYIPVSIGSYTIIGTNCTINAAAIGSMCYIGNNVTLGDRCIIKDNCIINDNTIIPNDIIIAPFTNIKQNDDITKKDGKLVFTELSPSISVLLQERAIDTYDQFILNLK